VNVHLCEKSLAMKDLDRRVSVAPMMDRSDARLPLTSSTTCTQPKRLVAVVVAAAKTFIASMTLVSGDVAE
jgi:hypothetical protein